MTALSSVSDRLGMLIPLLASNHDGEVVATARAISRTLASAGADWHDLASAVTGPSAQQREPPPPPRPWQPTSWADLCSVIICCHSDRLSTKEDTFVNDMSRRLVLGGEPTEKQAKWLRNIWARVGGGAG